MGTRQINEVVQHLRRTALIHDGSTATDGQLLDCYVNCRDETALAALVRRHGPMVWGVCRRVLHHHQDAEDAFQAAFLVLVRKAAAVAPRSMVGNWLYGVAHQTALKTRATVAKRMGRERQVGRMPEPSCEDQPRWRDLQSILDNELSRLPDRYRAVIVLCDLEGRTRKEAAQQLGCPEGSIAGWLARARSMLAKRLRRHGIMVSGGALATLLTQNASSAGVPSAVLVRTIDAAGLFAVQAAAFQGAVDPRVAAITEGVLKSMLLAKLKAICVCLVAVTAFAFGLNAWPHASGAPHNEPTVPHLPAARGVEPDGGVQDPDPRQTKVQKPNPGEVFGYVEKVDAEKKVITVTVPMRIASLKKGAKKALVSEGQTIRLENLPIGKATKITINGKEGKLADVGGGMVVTLELEVAGLIQVKRLEARDQ
jgi:RNA polymerase sigma factor (sigma-70 family)